MAVIELTDVSKTYDLGEVQVHALQSTTLQIDRGEYVALLGPSGSGKSTLMNTLGCLDRPTTGSYLLNGIEVATLSRNGRAGIRNQHIGFVFQNFNLLASSDVAAEFLRIQRRVNQRCQRPRRAMRASASAERSSGSSSRGRPKSGSSFADPAASRSRLISRFSVS